MANQLYGYNPSYGAAAANLSSVYASRSVTDPFLSDSSLLSSSRYLSSDHLSSDPSYYSVTERHSSMFDGLRFSASDIGGSGAFSSRIPGGIGASVSTHGVDVGASVDPLVAGLKRPSEGLIYIYIYIFSFPRSIQFLVSSFCSIVYCFRLTTQHFSFWKCNLFEVSRA